METALQKKKKEKRSSKMTVIVYLLFESNEKSPIERKKGPSILCL
jgi:hypothetical protein